MKKLSWLLKCWWYGHKVDRVTKNYYRALDKNARLKGQYGKSWTVLALHNWVKK